MEQPATIGTLPIAVAHTEGVLVGYLPGLAMRCIADLRAGDAKTDARDAAIIAQAARALPHALRGVQLADEQLAVLSMLCGFGDDLVGQATSTSNRTRASSPRFTPPWNGLSARIWTMRPCCARTAPSTVTRSWPTIQHTNAILDENSGKWISVAEVAEVPFTAFVGRKKAEHITGRLVVRRIPELNPKETEGQPTLFDSHRFHAFFTTSGVPLRTERT